MSVGFVGEAVDVRPWAMAVVLVVASGVARFP